MSKRTPALILAAVMATALLATGCGGGDEEVTKAEFIKQADAICRQGEKDKQAKMETFLAKSSASAEEPLKLDELQELATDAILPPMRVMVEELSELPEPSEGGEKATAIIVEFDETVSDLEKNPLPLAGGKSNPFDEVSTNAEKYGFKTCILYY